MRTIEEIQASVNKVTDDLKVGDYVFACKYSDADPRDRWYVGTIGSIFLTEDERSYVQFLETGMNPFRYAVKISKDEGEMILREWSSLYP